MSKLFEKMQKGKTGKFLIQGNVPKNFLSFNVLPVNVLFSGRMLDGGLPYGGIGQISAESATGKSSLAFSLMAEAQRQGFDIMYFDCEKTFDENVANAYGINSEEIIRYRFAEIHKIKQTLVEAMNAIDEEFDKSGTAKKFDNLDRILAHQRVLVVIDSWGALVTEKSIAKAEEGQAMTEMAGAQLAGAKGDLANYLRETEFTYFIVNHISQNIGMGEPYKVPGGSKLRYHSDGLIAVYGAGAKEKVGDKVIGKTMNARILKGRNAREFATMQYRINQEGGLDPFFGLLDDAMEFGIVYKEGLSWKSKLSGDKKFSKDELYTDTFWVPICNDVSFKEWMLKRYTFEESSAELSVKGGIGMTPEEVFTEEETEMLKKSLIDKPINLGDAEEIIDDDEPKAKRGKKK